MAWGAPTPRAKPGTWSDDGSLTLALLDSLSSVGFDTADQARRFLAWADAGAYTPHGEGKFDIGYATAAAFARLGRGVPAEEAGADPDSQGNGKLMKGRLTPISNAATDVSRSLDLMRLAILRGVNHVESPSSRWSTLSPGPMRADCLAAAQRRDRWRGVGR